MKTETNNPQITATQRAPLHHSTTSSRRSPAEADPLRPIHESTNPSIQSPSAQPPPPHHSNTSPRRSPAEAGPSTISSKPSTIPSPLDSLRHLLTRFVVLPPWAPEALALWVLHTYAFELRDVATYIGIESPARRCGKTTLLTILSRLVHRPVIAANVSPTALFRVIEEMRPTLLIDEADTFLKSKDALQGILNAGYTKSGFVLRLAPRQSASASASSSSSISPTSPATRHSSLASFSCWCPKIICQIGSLPHTLADRCIIIRIQRKTPREQCERLRDLETSELQQQCARFVSDHAGAIASARPDLPAQLNDRAADIWEPLLALADLAGGSWPDLARQAAIHLSAAAHDHNPIGALLLDILVIFVNNNLERLFTRGLVAALNCLLDRPWAFALKGKTVTDLWLSHQLRPFGIKPRNLCIDGAQAKGYLKDDFIEVCARYTTKTDLETLKADSATTENEEDSAIAQC
jgi:putative DNA primase/helicase